jgi:hypothetical protein
MQPRRVKLGRGRRIPGAKEAQQLTGRVDVNPPRQQQVDDQPPDLALVRRRQLCDDLVLSDILRL